MIRVSEVRVPPPASDCLQIGTFSDLGTRGIHLACRAFGSAWSGWTVSTRGMIGEDHALMPSLLTLSDVLGTGHHAAVVARVEAGDAVAVVGDGAVCVCGVIAAKRLGAEQIIIMGRHEDRTSLARELGATDVVAERGDEAVQRIMELTGGFGAHGVRECVGTEAS